jgi:hypothetical protein
MWLRYMHRLQYKVYSSILKGGNEEFDSTDTYCIVMKLLACTDYFALIDGLIIALIL